MLVRVKVGNFLSFKDPVEFNMLIGEARRFTNHIKTFKNVKLLKLAAIYGANASGKSSLINTLDTMKEFVQNGKLENEHVNNFKFYDNQKNPPPSLFEVEFISNGKAFLYGFEVKKNQVLSEWLYKSGLGSSEDILVFERNLTDNRINIEVNTKSLKSSKDKVLVEHYRKKILKNNQLLLSLFYDAEISSLHKDIKVAFEWFERLAVIFPSSSPTWLLFHLLQIPDFFEFSNEILESVDTGIKKLHIKTFDFGAFFGEDDKKLSFEIEEELYSLEDQRIPLDIDTLAIIEDDKPVIKKLFIEHYGFGDEKLFSFYDESEGTQRIIEYLSIIFGLVVLDKATDKVFIIDEIERSIHPCLIKALMTKLSKSKIYGQLIFSTHESNLLDLDLLRSDEIWFSEKDNEIGNTSFYPLSEYKVRTDLDARKGYLNGRFGAIPILANFNDLNWTKYDQEKPK